MPRSLRIDAGTRTARLTVRGPDADEPADAAGIRERGAEHWALRAFRELDDALLDLRLNHPAVGLVLLRAEGDPGRVLAVDRALVANAGDWFVDEITALMKRTLKRLDVTSRSFFALVEPDTCFAD